MSTTHPHNPPGNTAPQTAHSGSKMVWAPTALLLVVLGAYGVWSMSRWLGRDEPPDVNPEAIVLKPGPRPLAPIASASFVDQHGKAFDFDSLKGKVWTANLFFTSCPGVCTSMMQSVGELVRHEDLSDVYFISISTDPDNDTPERMAEYAGRFRGDPERWIYLRGSHEETDRLSRELFSVRLDKERHSERIAVVDQGGNWVATYNALDGIDQFRLRQKLKLLAAPPAKLLPPEPAAH